MLILLILEVIITCPHLLLCHTLNNNSKVPNYNVLTLQCNDKSNIPGSDHSGTFINFRH